MELFISILNVFFYMDINITTIYILKVNQHIDDKKMNGEKIRQKRTFGKNGEFFRRKL